MLSFCLQTLTAAASSLVLLQPPPSEAAATSPSDLTDLCCTTEISARISDHAILAKTRYRTLARLYKTPAYNQVRKQLCSRYIS